MILGLYQGNTPESYHEITLNCKGKALSKINKLSVFMFLKTCCITLSNASDAGSNLIIAKFIRVHETEIFMLFSIYFGFLTSGAVSWRVRKKSEVCNSSCFILKALGDEGLVKKVISGTLFFTNFGTLVIRPNFFV